MTEGRNPTVPRTTPDPWLTLLQAAKALRKHRQTVLGLGAAGELTIERRAGITFVTRASVDAYKAAHPDAYADEREPASTAA